MVVRCLEPADAPALHDAVVESAPTLRDWLPWARRQNVTLNDRVKTLREFRARFDLDEDHTYGIFTHDGQFVGGTGLHARGEQTMREVGYWIRTPMQRNGFASESVGALVRVGFEIERLEYLELHCHIDNHNSAAVARRLGFQWTSSRVHDIEGPDGVLGTRCVWKLGSHEVKSSWCQSVWYEATDVLGRSF